MLPLELLIYVLEINLAKCPYLLSIYKLINKDCYLYFKNNRKYCLKRNFGIFELHGLLEVTIKNGYFNVLKWIVNYNYNDNNLAKIKNKLCFGNSLIKIANDNGHTEISQWLKNI